LTEDLVPIDFKPPWPPVFHDPSAFYLGMVVGFAVVLLATIFADKLGAYLFHRGYAKPFYIRGHRIHHVWIYLIIPLSYLVFSALLLLGYVLPVWPGMYLRLASIFLVAGVCMGVDFFSDKHWPHLRKDVILHHEWVYLVIFLYVIQFVVEVRV
jgi:hypothetical protein